MAFRRILVLSMTTMIISCGENRPAEESSIITSNNGLSCPIDKGYRPRPSMVPTIDWIGSRPLAKRLSTGLRPLLP